MTCLITTRTRTMLFRVESDLDEVYEQDVGGVRGRDVMEVVLSPMRKSTTPGTDRRQLPMLAFENSSRGRGGEGSYGRFDPVQNSLCARVDRPLTEIEERPIENRV